MQFENASLVLAFGLSVLCLTGCVVDTSPAPVVVVPFGTAQIDWTINGTNDPNQCAQSAATSLSTTVFDSSGAFVGEFRQACEAFIIGITLAPGTYSAQASLLDAAGNARTTEVPIAPFTIFGNDVLRIPIDFPASSFFTFAF
jgi:hypothetical protein